MQKKLIALAIAGLASSAAFAQTNVVIYGVADVGYFNLKSDQAAGVKDNTFSGLIGGGLSGSRLGFKATEDLGGGLSAGMLYEFGTVAPDGGGGATAAAPVAAGAGSVSGLNNIRQSYVHITSASMGSFQAGRIYTAGTNAAGKFDPEGASAFGPVSRLTNGLALSIDGAGGNNARVNNSIAWLSPNWKGFTAQVQYAFGENGEQTAAGGGSDDARMWGLGLDYTNGPMAVGFAYNDWSDYGGTSAAVGSAERELTEWFLGASYDFGMLKLTGSYQDFDMDNMAAAAGQGATGLVATGIRGAKSEGDIWSVGVIVPVMKAGSIRLSYASLDRSTRAAAGAPKLSADADGWGLSYQHALSKRTTAYVGYSTLDNDRNSAISIAGNVNAPAAGKDSSGFGMGMRHTF